MRMQMKQYIQKTAEPEDRKNLGWLYGEIASWSHGDLLDYGCNNCNLFDYYDKGSYIGVDLPNVIRKFGKVYSMTTEQFWRRKTKYDTIVLANVIEHLENHVSLLSMLAKRLKKGGKMIIVVPNPNSTKKAIAALVGYPISSDKHHLHGFTVAEILHLSELMSMASYNYYAPTLKKEFIISIWEKK